MRRATFALKLHAGLGPWVDYRLARIVAKHVFTTHGLLPVNVAALGDCLLLAALRSLGLPEELAPQLRQLLVSSVAARIERGEQPAEVVAADLQAGRGELALPTSASAYASQAGGQRVYIGYAELLELSRLLHLVVVVHTARQCWRLVDEADAGRGWPELHLLYVNGCHFLALNAASKDESGSVTLAPQLPQAAAALLAMLPPPLLPPPPPRATTWAATVAREPLPLPAVAHKQAAPAAKVAGAPPPPPPFTAEAQAAPQHAAPPHAAPPQHAAPQHAAPQHATAERHAGLESAPWAQQAQPRGTKEEVAYCQTELLRHARRAQPGLYRSRAKAGAADGKLGSQRGRPGLTARQRRRRDHLARLEQQQAARQAQRQRAKLARQRDRPAAAAADRSGGGQQRLQTPAAAPRLASVAAWREARTTTGPAAAVAFGSVSVVGGGGHQRQAKQHAASAAAGDRLFLVGSRLRPVACARPLRRLRCWAQRVPAGRRSRRAQGCCSAQSAPHSRPACGLGRSPHYCLCSSQWATVHRCVKSW